MKPDKLLFNNHPDIVEEAGEVEQKKLRITFITEKRVRKVKRVRCEMK